MDKPPKELLIIIVLLLAADVALNWMQYQQKVEITRLTRAIVQNIETIDIRLDELYLEIADR